MISVTIVLRSGERRLKEVLRALSPFDDVVVIDLGSSSKIRETVSEFSNVRLFESPYKGFGKAQNLAASLAKYDWILSLEADEVVTTELVEELFALNLDEHFVYALDSRHYFNGREIRWCGWYLERRHRLYSRKVTSFSEALVDECVQVEGLQKVRLSNALKHYSCETISDFLVKMERYSTLFAEEYKGKRKATPFGAFCRGLYRFFYSYVIRRGFLGGFEGLVVSSSLGITCFYKYLKLYQANRRERGLHAKKIDV